MSLLRRRMMEIAQNEPTPVDETLIIFGNVNSDYPPSQGDYGFSCTINGITNEYYQNGSQYYVHDSGDGWNYDILCNGETAGRTPTDFSRISLPSGIMSDVNSLIDSKDSTAQTLELSGTVIANTPIYVVKSKTVNGVEKYALAHKVQVGTVDENYTPYGGREYGLRMTLNGNYYHYYSDNPLYIVFNGSGYNLLGGGQLNRQPSQSFGNTPSGAMMYVNPNITRMESQSRSKAVIDSIISNHPVYLVKIVATRRYFYESTT